MDYKSTLNLPKTTFAMKGNLPHAEPKVLARWDEEKLYQKLLAARAGKTPFILHDGPPYANGDIHMGHALNKILKDFIVRYQAMKGNQVPFVPGWDCHGLPIEYALMKELKVTKHQVDIATFRKQARQYATKYVGIQREQFKRLGCIGDWEDPYLTLKPEFVSAALRALAKLHSKGFVYRARKPVNWCWSCETALAEAEVEYETHTSPSVYVKCKLEPSSIAKLAISDKGVRRVFLVIWTTTPWTLIGNVAIAVHPSSEYAVWKIEKDEAWITLSRIPENAGPILGLTDPRLVVETFQGKQLEGLKYQHPFGLRQGQVVLADYVSVEEGTGLVHIAPGFGAEDYAIGKQYGLEVLAPVDSKGQFVGLQKPVDHLNGIQVHKANSEVLKLLAADNVLVKSAMRGHSYPHCWRCRNPIIFRATDQWFLNVEKENLRGKLLATAEKKVKWVPPEAQERMVGMLKTRPDWCLSRQRLWGIPIPTVICSTCGEGILNPQVIENFASAIESDPEGSDKWFTEPVTRWLPKGFACSCGGTDFKTGTDILDVWFDSGVSHEGVLRKRPGLSFPADLYLEGSDQHRGWFQVSLITSVAMNGTAPYKGVLTHGFVVDGEGRKMSKSLGNVMAPQEVIASLGADLLRLWVASSDYREDVRISPVILSQVAEAYRKIRNTLRYCLANISDFDPRKDGVPSAKMESVDRWVISHLGTMLAEVTDSYERYVFHKVVRSVHEFCTVELSNFYLDVVKDRLYTSLPNDPKRRSTQTALFRIADTLIRVMNPIIPMTAEEAWGALHPEGKESVALQSVPRVADVPQDVSLEKEWGRLLQFRDEAMKVLEKAREAGAIGDSIEAELELLVRDKNTLEFLVPRWEALEAACIVSSLHLTNAPPGTPAVEIIARRSSGTKCQRCWLHLTSVGQSKEHPDLCHRCVEVVQKLAVT